MHYDYDDYYDGPSAADEIINEAIQKLKELIKSEIKDHIQKANNLYETVKEISRKNDMKQKEIEERAKELNQGLNKLSQDIYEKLLKKLDFDLKYGQEVWYVQTINKTEVCDVCEGKREVIHKSKSGKDFKYSCPKCYGRGVNNVVDCKKPVKDYISSIYRTLKVADKQIDKSMCSDMANDKVYLQKNDSWKYREELYLSEEECLNAIKTWEDK